MTKLMRTLPAALIAATSLYACSGPATRTSESYELPGTITALIVDSKAAGVTVEAADGPVTVTEEHRYSAGPPTTSHAVSGGTLRLTNSGCADDDARCEVRFHVRLPAAAGTEITALAGAVRLLGMTGAVKVTTEVGAVEGSGLSSSDVAVTTETGAVTLGFATAPTTVQVRSGLGAVSVGLPDDRAYDVSANADTGTEKVSVRTDPTSPHRVDIRTEVGAVTVEPSAAP